MAIIEMKLYETLIGNLVSVPMTLSDFARQDAKGQNFQHDLLIFMYSNTYVLFAASVA